jgi:hypothetical protein
MALDITVSPGFQYNVASNEARGLVFFGFNNDETTDTLCYNYKTGQWTSIPAYDVTKQTVYSISDPFRS